MAFDPDKYLAKSAPFDPNAYLGTEGRGNIINTDVPTVVGERQNPQPIAETPRTMADKLKALYEVPATIGSAAIAQPIGAAYGVYKGMTSPQYGTQQGVQQGQQAGAELAQKLQYQPTSPVTQDVLQGVGGAIEAAKLPPYMGNIGMIPSMAQASQVVRPLAQEAVQATKPAINTMAQALRREPSIVKTAPSAEQLAQTSKNLFTSAKESGVELNAKDFATNMAGIGKELRNEGYDPRLYPKIAVALDEMTQAGIPKDFNELSTLRKFIQGAQKSSEPDERRLATILKDDFDTYVSNIPESSVVGGSKEGLKQWKEARDTYAKLSKSEVFTDMLENAQLDKSKFSMSGIENSLAQQLRQLSKNDKKMRLFTQEEQEAIKKAAKGGVGQNALRFVGKFAPTSAVSSIPALLATSVSGPIGLAATAASMGARVGATQMRKSDVNKLAALMRAGVKGKENE
tara:strand:- start:6139 stop:7512 length:1374 start_codon:yes stop_codon:yes gene_type:complete